MSLNRFYIKNRAGQKALNFQSVIGLSEYSEFEYLDNSVTRQEVAFCPAFLLGNNRVYTNRDWANDYCPTHIVDIILVVTFETLAILLS